MYKDCLIFQTLIYVHSLLRVVDLMHHTHSFDSSKWKTLDTMKNEESLQFNISIRKCITATWVMHSQCTLWCSELVCLKKKWKKRETHLFGILVRILITLFGSIPVYVGRPFIGYHISHLQVHFVRTKFDIYVFINNTTTKKQKWVSANHPPTYINHK